MKKLIIPMILIATSFAFAEDSPLQKEIKELVNSRRKAEADSQVKINLVYLDKLRGIEKKAESSKELELAISLKKEIAYVESETEDLKKVKDLSVNFDPKVIGVKFTHSQNSQWWVLIERDGIKCNWMPQSSPYKRNGNEFVAKLCTVYISDDGSYLYYKSDGDVEKSRYYRPGKTPASTKKNDTTKEPMTADESTLFGRRVKQ